MICLSRSAAGIQNPHLSRFTVHITIKDWKYNKKSNADQVFDSLYVGVVLNLGEQRFDQTVATIY